MKSCQNHNEPPSKDDRHPGGLLQGRVIGRNRTKSVKVKGVPMTAFEIPREKIARFCKENRIRRLSLFGSILREDFTSASDIDVLVEFEPDARVGLIRLSALERELGELLGRRVDMNTPAFLSKYFRDRILSEAAIQYDAT